MLRPIGIVHSPFDRVEGMPIQAAASDAAGHVEVFPAFAAGLRDLDGFDHVVLLYRFHLCPAEKLEVTPFLDKTPRGVFATRAPARPNRLGLSVVRLVGVRGTRLDIEGVDVVSGTPLLDIKPYVPAFDVRVGGRIGWLAGRIDDLAATRSDDRMR